MSNRFKIQAFFKEFPFLESICDIEKVEKAGVVRISKDFLMAKPRTEVVSGSLVNINDSEQVFLFDSGGNLLTEVKPSRSYHYMGNCEEPGETVGEALLRIDSTRVHFAATVRIGYEIRDHRSVGGYCVTLYKSPKRFTLLEWVEEQELRANKEVQAMIAETESEV